MVLLGDVTESLPLSDEETETFATSARLRPLFEELSHRRAILVPGNHDQRALSVLRRCFGRTQVALGGFRIGRVAFVHGHEAGLDGSHWVNDIVPWVVTIGASLERLGIPVHFGTATNDEIAAPYSHRGSFVVFGHTHDPQVGPRYANTGCFLQGQQSFVTLDGDRLSLWKGLWQ